MIDPRIREYEAKHGRRLLGVLGPGAGQDGIVLRSDRLTAVKFFDRLDRFERELEVYQVLGAGGIHAVAGHNVPELIEWDEPLRVIEMSVVERPFVLDFAGAKRSEEVPDFEQQVIDEHLEHVRELFGDRWADALHVAEMFRLANSVRHAVRAIRKNLRLRSVASCGILYGGEGAQAAIDGKGHPVPGPPQAGVRTAGFPTRCRLRA